MTVEEINVQNQSQMSAVMYAAEYGHSAVVQALCEAGADPNLRDRNDTTALGLAFTKGHLVSIAMVLTPFGAHY